jgi:hypothetical protein
MSTVSRTESMDQRCTGLMASLNVNCPNHDPWLGFKQPNGYTTFQSWPSKLKPMARAAPPSSVCLRSKQSTGRHGHRQWSAQTQLMEREMKQRLLLRDLEEKVIPFYSLSVEETIRRELAMAAWRSWTLTTSLDLVRASRTPRSSPRASP